LIHTESEIVTQFQLVQKFKIYLKFEKKNLFLYAKDVCGLSENQAYTFSALAKCSLRHPQLNDAIQSGKLPTSKAFRLVSTLTERNAADLIHFACHHSKREIEREVRRLNPKASIAATIKPLSEELDVLNTSIPREASENIRKAADLLAQKHGCNVELGETIALVFAEFVERYDPVKRAARAEERKEYRKHKSTDKDSTSVMQPRSVTRTPSTMTNYPATSYPHFSARAEKSGYRRRRNDEPLTAAQIHMVDLRDARQCTSIDRNGHRCPETRWLHYHHIVSRANGGSNEPENLTTLCSFHHDLVHQLSFAMDGQMNFIRDRSVRYA
jgi:5-methylcytosine-specific restriction endonuclease McrA